MMSRAKISVWGLLVGGFFFFVFFALFWVFLGLYVDHMENNIDVKQQTYDYIVIGSGPGGASVTYQIINNKTYTVLVLEAGPDADNELPIQSVPFAFPGILEGQYFNEYFWQNTQAGNLDAPGVDMYTGGRLAGGSSSINNLQYVQGSNWVWEWFYNASGFNSLWSLNNVIESFRELETLICSSCNSVNHGYSGPLSILEEMNIAPQTTPTSFSQKFAKAFSQLSGYPVIGDYNNMTDSNQLGSFTSYQLSAFTDGTRCSSTTGILNRLKNSSRLTVKYNSFVSKIKFDGNVAKSVYYITDGHITQIAHARKEIIVAAGVNTPAILLHSGVGNLFYLNNIGVHPLVADNEYIGTKTWNHQVYVATFTKNASDTPSLNPNDLYEGGAFMPLPVNFTFPHPVSSQLGPRGFQFTAVNVPAPANLAVVVAFNLQPQSVGDLFIRNNDPLRTVAQNDNLYVGNNGANDMAQVLSMYQNYFCALSNEYQGTGKGPAVDTSYVIIDPPLSVCNNITLLTEYVQAYMPQHTHHWTGPCALNINPAKGAVDALGRVYGTKNLRVADATILGRPYDGNTQALAYQVGWTIGKAIVQGLQH